MPKIKYVEYNPTPASVVMIASINSILDKYEQQGFSMTLRQLYYQLVSRDLIPNNLQSYNRIGELVTRARDGGFIDWNRIEDRTRNVMSLPHWDDAESFMNSVVPQYKHDLWEGQERRCFVFVEKEALAQVVSRAAIRWDVPYFANKGYLSASSVWSVARNMMLLNSDCNDFVVIHLGDHDPSGLDMSRDIADRLTFYARPVTTDRRTMPSIEIRRIALNFDQIEQYSPPPNYAKETDSRYKTYADEFGESSWELDALEPTVIDSLIDDEIRDIVDFDKWNARKQLQAEIKKQLLSQYMGYSDDDGESDGE